MSTQRDPILNEYLAEYQRREADGVALYRPRSHQMPFHRSRAYIKILRGGNRSGKTTSWAVEIAAAALGVPLYDDKGEPIDLPYRKPDPDKPLVIWLIGWDERHLARVYRKLRKPGLFQCIKDRDTGKLRAWKPWDPEDAKRIEETVPSPPLLPDRCVAQESFLKKAEDQFSLIRLTNGTRIEGYSSRGEAGQGEDVDIIGIDEDIQRPEHVQEWVARTADRNAFVLWSAWPHTNNDALGNFSLRAEEQQYRDSPNVTETVLKFEDNQYITREARDRLIEEWAAMGPEVVRTRNLGQFLLDRVQVFPMFDIDIHGLPRRGREPDPLEKFLAERDFVPPPEWSHYLAVDPGTTHAAAGLYAVPPPWEYGHQVVCYAMFYGEQTDAGEMARALKLMAGDAVFQAFIIDAHAARQTPMGFGIRVYDCYEQAFAAVGLTSLQTGSGFVLGSDNITGGNMIVRRWLQEVGGRPMFRVVTDRTEPMQKEFRLYKKRMTKDDVKEEVEDRHNHAMDMNRYLAAFLAPRFEDNTAFVRLGPQDRPKSPLLKWLDTMKDKKPDDYTVHCGAGEPHAPQAA